MKKTIAFLTVFCLSAAARAEVVAVDGDSLLIDGRNIRLEGIDAPEYNQKCFDAQGRLYDCGRKSKETLSALVANGVDCVRRKIDRYKREVSICHAGELNVNREMVRRGQAVAYTRYLNDFAADEAEAKKAKRGIWSGRFMRPELFRVLEREQKREER